MKATEPAGEGKNFPSVTLESSSSRDLTNARFLYLLRE